MRNGFPLPLCILAAALISTTAGAATVIESESGAARIKSRMTVENAKARMQSEPVNYILIEPSAGQYLYVVEEKRQVVNMNAVPPADPNRSVVMSLSPKVKLVHKGKGPKIAGYATQRYQLYANGELCVTTYLSRDAMTRGQLKEFHADFYKMQVKQKQDLRTAGVRYAPCDDAQETLSARYPELGLAMRTVDADGQLRQEVVSVKTGVLVSSGFFQQPQGYRQLTHDEFIREMEGGGTPQEPAAAESKGGKS